MAIDSSCISASIPCGHIKLTTLAIDLTAEQRRGISSRSPEKDAAIARTHSRLLRVHDRARFFLVRLAPFDARASRAPHFRRRDARIVC
jgi:hypothetical protein